MFGFHGLKSILLFGYLKPDMLNKIERITKLVEYKTGQYLYREGDVAEHLYAVIEGRVVLEISQHSSSKIRIAHIPPQHTFGIECLIDTRARQCITDARAIADLKVFRWRSADLERLFYLDYELGFIFMKRLSKILKTRIVANDARLASSFVN